MKLRSRERIVLYATIACLCMAGCIPRHTKAAPEPAEAVSAETADAGDDAFAHAPGEAGEPAAAPASSVLEETPLSYEVGLFSWDKTCISGDKRAKLYLVLHKLGVTELYQDFSKSDMESHAASGEPDGSELMNEATHDFLHDLRLMGVDCYYLAGDGTLGLDPDGAGMRALISGVAAYNKAYPDAPFTGVCFDVETYLTAEWKADKDAVMRAMISAHKNAYAAAKEAGLRVILCLPVWYDTNGRTAELKELMQNACDEVSLMNYNRNREQEQIAYEVAYAQELGKPVTCIFEFQRVGAHGLKANETYFDIGIERAVESFETLYRAFGYPKLKFAYHYLYPLLEMLHA